MTISKAPFIISHGHDEQNDTRSRLMVQFAKESLPGKILATEVLQGWMGLMASSRPGLKSRIRNSLRSGSLFF
jgi:hypothetical protein